MQMGSLEGVRMHGLMIGTEVAGAKIGIGTHPDMKGGRYV
jgi:hypothetical protein